MLLTDVTGLKPNSERRVELKCDLCGRITQTTFANYNHAQKKNQSMGATKCKPCAIKLSAKARRGKPSHNKGKRLPQEQRGSGNPSWKGGRYIDAHGYVMVHVDRDKSDTTSGWEHYRKEHILIIEKHIGRPLVKGEVVHHIDGNRQNNKLWNLVLSNHTKHKDAHQSLQEIGYSLVKLGLVSFDRKINRYVAHVKWGELLEQLAEANQQPSHEGNLLEGSETRSRILTEDSNAPKSAPHSLSSCDDIVRTANITNEIAEPPDKERVG